MLYSVYKIMLSWYI